HGPETVPQRGVARWSAEVARSGDRATTEVARSGDRATTSGSGDRATTGREGRMRPASTVAILDHWPTMEPSNPCRNADATGQWPQGKDAQSAQQAEVRRHRGPSRVSDPPTFQFRRQVRGLVRNPDSGQSWRAKAKSDG